MPAPSTTKMRVYIAADMTDEEIAEKAGWDLKTIDDLRKEVIAQEEARVIGLRSEETYVNYSIRMSGIVRELDQTIEELRDGAQGDRQGGALVSAIKAKADIHDRVIKLGQDMGFVDRKPERKEIVIGKLTDKELARQLQLQMRRMSSMIDDYGDNPFEALEKKDDPAILTALNKKPVTIDVEPEKKGTGLKIQRHKVVRRKAILPQDSKAE